MRRSSPPSAPCRCPPASRDPSDSLQVMGELIGSAVQLAIAQLLFFKHQRRGLGCALDLGLEHLMDAARLVLSAVSFHGWSICRRSASLISVRSATRFSGSATISATSVLKCSAMRATVASSKRSALYSNHPPISFPSSDRKSVRSNFAVVFRPQLAQL